jgi:DNA-binding Xre family transcriptional regulator
MPEPTVKNVLTGRSVRPSTFGRIAKALNVDPEELLETEAAPYGRT